MVKEVSLSAAPAFDPAAIGTNADIAFGATPAMSASGSAATAGGTEPEPTSAGRYADEITPDAPTTKPTLAVDYVDEVRGSVDLSASRSCCYTVDGIDRMLLNILNSSG
jgi:hypothetical protein